MEYLEDPGQGVLDTDKEYSEGNGATFPVQEGCNVAILYQQQLTPSPVAQGRCPLCSRGWRPWKHSLLSLPWQESVPYPCPWRRQLRVGPPPCGDASEQTVPRKQQKPLWLPQTFSLEKQAGRRALMGSCPL